jgi:hypothetical protein
VSTDSGGGGSVAVRREEFNVGFTHGLPGGTAHYTQVGAVQVESSCFTVADRLFRTVHRCLNHSLESRLVSTLEP